MKTLAMIPLTLKKARTVDSISTIDNVIGGAMRDVSEFLGKLVAHNKNFIQENPPKLVRAAERELVRCESLLNKIIEKTLPVSGRPYRPSGLERQVIDELERSEGSWLAAEEVLH